jgi:hypothetical protein
MNKRISLAKWGGVVLLTLVSLGFLTGTLLEGFAPKNPVTLPPPLKGMALGTFSQEQNYSYLQDLDELKVLGTNAILLMVPWYQKDIRDNRMAPRWGWNQENITLPDSHLKALIKRAHELNMQVLLMPYLRFDHRETKEWRGVLEPKNLAEWQKNYTQFILNYAGLAESWGVEFFSVGSELGSMEREEAFWRGLIGQVRQKYRGQLLYSANWDHYTIPTFWRDLDAIGISSYHRLTENENPRLSQLKRAWEKTKKQMLAFQKNFPGKKLIITEVGYPSLKGASRDPWNYFATTPTDLQEQAMCYRAFIEVWNGTPELQGVFWWVWFGPGGPEDRSYTPRGKPAAQILKHWYNSHS